ncbi:hypothetical protein KR222_000980 [Zaprionus bogoriensis]|nr:hypothetical protein KR222_000980 [Zaprionus bogoriensis]
MSMRFSLALLLMVAMSQLMQEVDGRKKICGEALSDMLDLICVNGFSHRITRRRRSPEQDLLYKWKQLAMQQEFDRLAALESDNGAGAEDADDKPGERLLRRPRRRIAHQCCSEGCTYDDIARYCA